MITPVSEMSVGSSMIERCTSRNDAASLSVSSSSSEESPARSLLTVAAAILRRCSSPRTALDSIWNCEISRSDDEKKKCGAAGDPRGNTERPCRSSDCVAVTGAVSSGAASVRAAAGDSPTAAGTADSDEMSQGSAGFFSSHTIELRCHSASPNRFVKSSVRCARASFSSGPSALS